MAYGELPEELSEFAKYNDCDRFARNFVQRYPEADYRRIMLIRRTTSDNFGFKEHNYLSHSWIEYKGMLLMAYSGLDSGLGSAVGLGGVYGGKEPSGLRGSSPLLED